MYSKNNESYKLFLAGIISESDYFSLLEQQPVAAPAQQQAQPQQQAPAQQQAQPQQQPVDHKKQAEGLFGQISKTLANQMKADVNLQAIMPQVQKYFIDLYAQTAQKQAAKAPAQPAAPAQKQ